MIVGIIGSGGREHAICHKINLSKKVTQIYCLPGNAGTAKIAKNMEIDISNFDLVRKFCLDKKINLLIVGPEKPLVDGIVDYFRDTKILVFGPNQKVSKLEGSKIFTKEMCKKYNIPTANFKIFENMSDVKQYLKKINFPIVVKADGLAAGKGVYICKDYDEANLASEEIFNGKFGIAKKILIEEFLEGEEMSYFVISDGESFKFFGTAQDHKRVGEGDTGKNTGGMGCYSPSRLYTSNLENKINDKIIMPTFKAIKEIGSKYIGFLYVGLMIKNNEPYLVEFNVRMGDPECQTLLPLLNTSLLDIILSCCQKQLRNQNIEFKNKKSICIVLCSKGYPEEYNKNIEIKNLKKLNPKENENIFHAGTKIKDGKVYSAGGRVLNFVSVSENFKKTRENLMNLILELDWENGYFRKDIAYKVID